MSPKLEALIQELKESGSSAALAVADHLETVAANGREYGTNAAMIDEADSLKAYAQLVVDRLSASRRTA